MRSRSARVAGGTGVGVAREAKLARGLPIPRGRSIFAPCLVASNLPMPREEKALLLTELDPARRLVRVESALEREVTIAETQRQLRSESELEGANPREREPRHDARASLCAARPRA